MSDTRKIIIDGKEQLDGGKGHIQTAQLCLHCKQRRRPNFQFRGQQHAILFHKQPRIHHTFSPLQF